MLPRCHEPVETTRAHGAILKLHRPTSSPKTLPQRHCVRLAGVTATVIPPPNDDTSRIAFRGDRARGRVCGTGRPASGQRISAMRREPLAKLGNPIVAGDKFLRNVVSDCIEHRCIRRVARCALVIRMQCLRGERRGFDVEHCKRRPTSAIYGRSVAHTRPWRRRLHQASSSGAAATMASPLSAMPYITATKTYPCFVRTLSRPRMMSFHHACVLRMRLAVGHAVHWPS